MSVPSKPARGLGRGLDALLPQRPPAAAPTPIATAEAATLQDGRVFICAIERIRPKPDQPRQHFDPVALAELTESIKEHGLLEPVVVRRIGTEDRFELLAGERRWRASQAAGLSELPAMLRNVDDKQALEIAIVENVQREDLDPVEFAEALDRLIKEFGYSLETAAARVGKDRSTVSNALRLLKLPEAVRKLVISRQLTEGHARALLGAPDERSLEKLAEKVVTGRMSVRQAESLVRDAKAAASGDGEKKKPTKSAGVRDLEQRLERRFGARCRVEDKGGSGELRIAYSSLDDLDRILDLLFSGQ